jgi:hypothetical protein
VTAVDLDAPEHEMCSNALKARDEKLRDLMLENRFLRIALARTEIENAENFDALTRAQARSTELIEELRTIKAGIVLPGFTCACGAFNGDEKEKRTTCRACDAARPA